MTKIRKTMYILATPLSVLPIAATVQCMPENSSGVSNLDKINQMKEISVYVKSFANEAKTFIDNYASMQHNLIQEILEQSKVQLSIQQAIADFENQQPNKFKKYFVAFSNDDYLEKNVFIDIYNEFLQIPVNAPKDSYIQAQSMGKLLTWLESGMNAMLVCLNQYFGIESNYSFNIENEFKTTRALYQSYYLMSLYNHMIQNLNLIKNDNSNKKISDFISELQDRIISLQSSVKVEQNIINLAQNHTSMIQQEFFKARFYLNTYQSKFGHEVLNYIALNLDSSTHKSNGNFVNSTTSLNNQTKIAFPNTNPLEIDYLYLDPNTINNPEAQDKRLIKEIDKLKLQGYELVSKSLYDDFKYDKKYSFQSNLTNNVAFDLALISKQNNKFSTTKAPEQLHYATLASQSKELNKANYLVRMQVNAGQLKSLGVDLVKIIPNQIANDFGVLFTNPKKLVADLKVQNDQININLGYNYSLNNKNYVIPSGWDTLLYPDKNLNVAFYFPKQVALGIFNIYISINQETYNYLSNLIDKYQNQNENLSPKAKVFPKIQIKLV
ncbi:hypothetical protein [Mycoplasma seminis]|uniref:Uncharacterized protein n=1 Tax=Mycoplasma seminis TaxID=512749 RepID=A0ABY9HC85_9MOLU|nr:hypothetical protein [Mycoplasma seminis]WLP85814.1 hypothetical protein Q8852_01560 [Mycoplasma seminis]